MAELTECECCSNQNTKDAPLRLFMAMWMCPSCIDKNKALSEQSAAQSEIRVSEERARSSEVVELNKILQKNNTVMGAIEVKTDIFNAETVSIIEISKAIQEDSSIENKPAKLAEVLLSNYQQYKEKIFSNNAENVELVNKQNAIQKYLNELRNKLTEAEREKYKLMDLNYKPNQVKISNKPINSPAKPKKYDKAEIVKAAARAGVPTSVIQMICVAKNMTPMQASDSLLEAGSKKAEV